MKRSSFLKRAVGVGVALTALDGVKLEKLFTERDDAAYIQSLVNKGGTVYLPSGDFHLKRPIILKTHTHLIGGQGGPTRLFMHPENKEYIFTSPENLHFSGWYSS